MSNSKTELIPRWCGELAHYFNEEGSTPEVIIYHIRHAAMTIARNCAHPNGLGVDELEEIATALDYLSEIMDIVDKYQAEK